MVFTSALFIFLFFPAATLLWLVGKAVDRATKRTRLADILLVAVSLVFFGWTNYAVVYWMLAFIGVVYLFGLLIEQADAAKNEKIAKTAFTAGVVVLLFLLGYYKYRGFTIEILNQLFKSDLVVRQVLTPLGLSFLTFTAVSYLADVKMKKAGPGSLLDCALYLSFFPKLISGPIVLWRDFAPGIPNRRLNSEQISDGIHRICYGFAKKVILADTFGAAIATIDMNCEGQGIDGVTALAAILLYWLQIYYDFAGYSDIAIGLSKIFGFNLAENFRFPYLSSSIAEFWRRWHISLGAWFREYVYFPLGGSRKGKLRTILNLAIVFALTGIWHGAGYNYLLWGAINGFFVIFDHIMKENRVWKRVPWIIRWFGATLVSVAFWELFRFKTIGEAWNWFSLAIGRQTCSGYDFTWEYYITASLVFLFVVGFVGATVLGCKPIQDRLALMKGKPLFEAVKSVFCLALFVLSIIFMINSSYSPFIYFQY